VVTGKIRMVEDFGVFIVVDGSANISGLCHKSVMADQKVDNVKELYDVGDAVMAKVLKIIPEKRRVNFGLKASYFQDVEKGRSDGDEDKDTSGSEGLDGMDGLELAAQDSDEEMDDLDDEDGGIDLENVRDISSDDQELDFSEDENTTGPAEKASIGLSTSGFDWTAGLLDRGQKQDASDSEASDTEAQPKKKKRRKPEIQIDRTGDLDANGPQSQSDFERLLLGQPDSSFLWVSYMALQLQLSEIEKAREVAERALRTIGIREDAEKMNVWIALLNLENTYGDDSAVEEVFKKACQYCDVQEIHERLISIYIQSGKQEVSPSNPIFQII
jgi:rRNA biogenesis protein RRP5